VSPLYPVCLYSIECVGHLHTCVYMCVFACFYMKQFFIVFVSNFPEAVSHFFIFFRCLKLLSLLLTHDIKVKIPYSCCRGVAEISVAVFCLKLVRYCMYMWLPMYLEKQVILLTNHYKLLFWVSEYKFNV